MQPLKTATLLSILIASCSSSTERRPDRWRIAQEDAAGAPSNSAGSPGQRSSAGGTGAGSSGVVNVVAAGAAGQPRLMSGAGGVAGALGSGSGGSSTGGDFTPTGEGGMAGKGGNTAAPTGGFGGILSGTGGAVYAGQAGTGAGGGDTGSAGESFAGASGQPTVVSGAGGVAGALAAGNGGSSTGGDSAMAGTGSSTATHTGGSGGILPGAGGVLSAGQGGIGGYGGSANSAGESFAGAAGEPTFTSGAAGEAGFSGSAGEQTAGWGGIPGYAGSSGAAGSPGYAGSGGAAGSPGYAGSGGAAGSAGYGGSAGSAGADNCVEPYLEHLVLWLSADVAVIDDPVIQWGDRSPASNTATQPEINYRPTVVRDALNGLPVVRFDGVDDRLLLPDGFDDFSPGISAFVVANYSSDIGRGRILSLKGTLPSGAILAQRQVDTLDFIYMATDLDGTPAADVTAVAPDAITLGTASLLSLVHQPSGDVALYHNGELAGSDVFPLPPVMNRTENQIGAEVGGAHAFAGDLAEALLYDTDLTDEERQQNACYLMQKWGLPQ